MYDRKGKPMAMEKQETFVVIVGAALVAITLICCATFFYYNQTLAVKSNIESAIVKGIDPLSVRCAYGDNSHVCIAYAVAHGKTSGEGRK
jgi:hypothetical protein